MYVTNESVSAVLGQLTATQTLALDTETQGLSPYKGDRPFSVILADAETEYYFDKECFPELKKFFSEKSRTYFLQNAKFDLHHLSQVGIELHPQSTIHDTMILARLVDSDLMSYSLDNLAKYFLDEEKDDKVKAYIEDNGLWEWQEVKGLDRRQKKMFFDKVPLDIMVPYAKKDARLTYDLGVYLLYKLMTVDSAPKNPRSAKVSQVITNESRLIWTTFHMERRGVLVDLKYCDEAIAYEEARLEEAKREYAEESGRDYKSSNKEFIEIFEERGVTEFGQTRKGNPSCDGKTLERIGDALSGIILKAKDAKARLNFYYGFLYQADNQGLIHTDFRSGGTKTGRFGSANPNLQNMTKNDAEELWPVRRAIVPFPDHCLVMIDYDQQEYRMMVDYANEIELIEKILGGLDVHQATADMVGLDRSQAKGLNFALLYGAGSTKVAGMLGIEVDEARDIIARYFWKLPKVKDFIDLVKRTAETKGEICNWYGRRTHYPDRKFAYRAPNALIQGGCADVMKVAMNRIADYLADKKSVMSLTIHDELVFNIHPSELAIVKDLKEIMEKAYPPRALPLTASVSHSWKSLGDKVKGMPELR